MKLQRKEINHWWMSLLGVFQPESATRTRHFRSTIGTIVDRYGIKNLDISIHVVVLKKLIFKKNASPFTTSLLNSTSAT